jgi:baseplate J-like protein
MAMRVLYLDVDDEITSAASRIRSAEEIRVAVVLPYGSRVATSRINFRLLARDATVNGKRLSIIAGDAATRALAASAGLPIYASVAEYESALEAEKAEKAQSNGGPPATGVAVAVPDVESPSENAPAVEAQATEAAETEPPARAARGGSRRKAGKQLATEDAATATAVAPSPIPEPPDLADQPPSTSIRARPSRHAAPARAEPPGAAVAASAASAASMAERVPVPPISPPLEPRPAIRGPAAVPAARVIADTPSRPAILDRPFAPIATRMPIAIAIAVLALAVVVGGVGAYLLLPTATVVITPREASIGPIELRITASPQTTEPDQAAKLVPATSVDVPVEASQTFNVTGKRVEETKAKGRVRFRNFDFTSSNTIPKGSVVSTQGGIRFRTNKSITIKRAERVLFQIVPASASVDVTAVNAGTDGNVEPNTITVIPRGEDPLTLDVSNPDATKGGKRDEFPRIAQADIDKATTALRAALTTAFQEKVGDPALAGEGTTVFPETASLGEPTLTTDPATLVGDEVATFDLGATASGTVLTVDKTAVTTVASADIATHVEPGYALVDGSSDVSPAQGIVEGGVITFPVTITARQVLQLDTAAIESEIRGKPLAEAQTILQRYGTPELSVWPDWVGTIPTIDARVDVRSSVPEAGTP